METTEYQNVISMHEIRRFPISMTTTAVNLTGSWRFSKPIFKEKISPCSIGCPANINIPKYIFYILRNDLTTAAKILRDENPFPAVSGRVCPHFCQSHCNREEYDDTVEIREIEKFIGDYALNIPYEKPKETANKHIAVIGSGPAGLSCAYFLAKNGYSVTIFERENFLGGLLMYGIPEYRLPHNIVNKEISNIINLENINIKLNENINSGRMNKISREYDAVFFSVGLNQSRIPENIRIDGKRIISGYDLLKKLNMDENFRGKFKNEKIAIIGGGNVAFDVARTILRLGNEVEIIYRRTLKEAPSFEEEKKEGLEESIKIKEKRIIEKIIESDKLNLVLNEVKNISDKGVEIGEVKETTEFDRVIIATGQTKEFDIEKKENIFIGGDYQNGAKTVIEAITSGKTNAFKIMNFLHDNRIETQNKNKDSFFRTKRDYDTYEVVPFEKINLFYFNKQEPLKIDKTPPRERSKNFREINLKPSLDKILNEAKRCFSCGVCNLCKTCWFVCPDICVTVKNDVHFDKDYCKGCGVCATECPRDVIDMVEDK